MRITAVECSAKRRGRVDVHVDGGLMFDVSRRVAAERGLRAEREIERDEIEEIVAEDRRRGAFDAAARLLARRPRSEREVRQRLRMRRFDTPLIEETVDRLRSLGLLDDAAFARSWAEARDELSPRGRRLISAELRARGVAAATADEATAGVSDADAAYRLASRRLRSLGGLEYPAFRDRLGGLLRRRGFGWDVVRQTVDRCWREAGREVSLDDM